MLKVLFAVAVVFLGQLGRAEAGFTDEQADTWMWSYAGLLAAGSLITDVPVAISLASTGKARRGWAITGLVFGGLNALGAYLVLQSAFKEPGLPNQGARQAAAVTYACFAVGSLVLHNYGFMHPAPDPDDEDDDQDGEENEASQARKPADVSSSPKIAWTLMGVPAPMGIAPGIGLSGTW